MKDFKKAYDEVKYHMLLDMAARQLNKLPPLKSIPCGVGIHGMSITTRIATDPSQSHDGGDYHYWTTYHLEDGRVRITPLWSCEISERGGEVVVEDLLGLGSLAVPFNEALGEKADDLE